MSRPSGYIGRFAPSPTGPLHFGSLLAAVASYLEARLHGGRWLVRVDDIDPPREQRGASKKILQALEAYGFEWDGEIIFQSASHDAHHAALERLRELGVTYACGCSRRDLQHARRSPIGIIYPGTCRSGTDASEVAIRVRTNNQPVEFDDGLQGLQSARLESESGDFVILRRDGLIAYQLAVVVDDHLEGVTDIVRGIDLMESTPRQIHLQSLLGYATPRYAHIPIAVHPDGSKLSKLTGAEGLPLDRPAKPLFEALTLLLQQPPGDLAGGSLYELWQWARENWDAKRMHGVRTVKIR